MRSIGARIEAAAAAVDGSDGLPAWTAGSLVDALGDGPRWLGDALHGTTLQAMAIAAGVPDTDERRREIEDDILAVQEGGEMTEAARDYAITQFAVWAARWEAGGVLAHFRQPELARWLTEHERERQRAARGDWR